MPRSSVRMSTMFGNGGETACACEAPPQSRPITSTRNTTVRPCIGFSNFLEQEETETTEKVCTVPFALCSLCSLLFQALSLLRRSEENFFQRLAFARLGE